jgi:CubicO group peptidase (beta-lactamase class C family)
VCIAAGVSEWQWTFSVKKSFTPGRFGWTGGFGTTAYTDPAEGMIGILLTQRKMDSPEPPKIFTDLWTLAYGAME